MKPETLDYIRYRMPQAQQAIQDARQLLETGSLHGAVNRLYYACFYMVSALLLTEDKYSRKHSGIESMFVRNWINTGRVPPELGRFYRRLFKRRQQGDYAYQVVFTQDQVNAWFREAQEFVAEIAKQIEKKLSAEEHQ